MALLCAASAGYGQTLPGGMAATYHMERDVDQWQLFVANDDSDARLVSHQGDLFIGIKARRGQPSLRVTLGNGAGLSPNYTMDIGNREFSAGRNGLVLEDDQLDGFVRALTSSTTATVETSRGISSLSLSGARGLIYLLYSRTAKPSRADAENSPLYNGDAERVALSSDPDVSAAEQAGPSRVSDPTASLQDPDANRSASSPDNSAYEVRARPGGRTTAISGIQPISFRNMDWTQDSREEAGGYHAIIIFGCFLIAYLCLFYILSVPFVSQPDLKYTGNAVPYSRVAEYRSEISLCRILYAINCVSALVPVLYVFPISLSVVYRNKGCGILEGHCRESIRIISKNVCWWIGNVTLFIGLAISGFMTNLDDFHMVSSPFIMVSLVFDVSLGFYMAIVAVRRSVHRFAGFSQDGAV